MNEYVNIYLEDGGGCGTFYHVSDVRMEEERIILKFFLLNLIKDWSPEHMQSRFVTCKADFSIGQRMLGFPCLEKAMCMDISCK